jgi:hypothetical protein
MQQDQVFSLRIIQNKIMSDSFLEYLCYNVDDEIALFVLLGTYTSENFAGNSRMASITLRPKLTRMGTCQGRATGIIVFLLHAC